MLSVPLSDRHDPAQPGAACCAHMNLMVYVCGYVRAHVCFHVGKTEAIFAIRRAQVSSDPNTYLTHTAYVHTICTGSSALMYVHLHLSTLSQVSHVCSKLLDASNAHMWWVFCVAVHCHLCVFPCAAYAIVIAV